MSCLQGSPNQAAFLLSWVSVCHWRILFADNVDDGSERRHQFLSIKKECELGEAQ